MSILKPEDFIGFQRVAGSNDTDATLQAYIDKYESAYINKVFGIKLGKLILANIAPGTTSPINAEYKKAWDSFQEVGPSDEQWVSEGMLELLKSVIFYHYIAFTTAQHTQAGVTAPEVDTQGMADSARFAEARWNNMLYTWEAIHAYVIENDSDYPDFVQTIIPDPKFNGLL